MKKIYKAVIETGKPATMTVIATGSRDHCNGAIEGWRAAVAADDGVMLESGIASLIVVEVAE